MSCLCPFSILLQSTDVVIHLANRSVAYPAGFIEDVLVWVGELIFLADFYVLIWKKDFPMVQFQLF